MGPAVIFGIGLVLALALQTYGGLRQHQIVQQQFRGIKARNPIVSVGRSTRWGMSRTAVLVFDQEGRVQEFYMLSGITVFAKLKRLYCHEGEHYSLVKQHYQQSKIMTCVMQAIRYMEEKYG